MITYFDSCRSNMRITPPGFRLSVPSCQITARGREGLRVTDRCAVHTLQNQRSSFDFAQDGVCVHQRLKKKIGGRSPPYRLAPCPMPRSPSIGVHPLLRLRDSGRMIIRPYGRGHRRQNRAGAFASLGPSGEIERMTGRTVDPPEGGTPNGLDPVL